MYHNNRDPKHARQSVRDLVAIPAGPKRWERARNTHLGPYPGTGTNRVAGLTNFRILLALIEDPDHIRVARLETLTGWSIRDITSILKWAHRRPQPWVHAITYRLYRLDETMKRIWEDPDEYIRQTLREAELPGRPDAEVTSLA